MVLHAGRELEGVSVCREHGCVGACLGKSALGRVLVGRGRQCVNVE